MVPVHSLRKDNHHPKKRGLSLREMEKQIEADLFDHIASHGGNLTVLDLVERYVETRVNVRPTTKTGYKTIINILKKDPFGSKRIDQVRISDAKLRLIKLQQKDHRGYSSIHCIRGVLRPAFQLAVDDDIIRKNPFSFQVVDVLVNNSVRRKALSREEERNFLKFVKEDPNFNRYYEGIYILLKTGMRISEFCGLTISDINFEEHSINIDHQLLKHGSHGYYIQQTKTNAGTRVIPMTPDDEACFRKIIDNRRPPKKRTDHRREDRISLLRQERQRDVFTPLGEILPAHQREVQQHLQGSNAAYNPSCVPSHLLFQYGKVRNES